MLFKSQFEGHEGGYPNDLDMYSFVFEYWPNSRPDVRGTSVPIIIDDETGQSWTFDEVKERVDALAVGLREITNLAWDTSIGIFSTNSVDFLTAMWASHRNGAIVSAANPAFTPSELAYQLEAAKVTHLFVNQNALKEGLNAADAAQIPREHVIIIQDPVDVRKMQKDNNDKPVGRVGKSWTLTGLVESGRAYLAKHGASSLNKGRRRLVAEEGKRKLAFLSFSSGTTGRPKAVAIQCSAPIANCLQMNAFNKVPSTLDAGKDARIRPGKGRSLGILPQYHIYGLVVCTHWMFYAGVTNVVIPRFKGIERMLQSIIRHKIDTWWLVPPQVVMLCKDPVVDRYIDQVREIGHFLMIGAAPLSNDLSKALKQKLPKLDWGQGWGMTESSTVGLMHPINQKPVLGSAGKLVSDFEAKVVRIDGSLCGPGEPGELWVRSPSVTLGYANNAEATAESFMADGFLRTGDEVIVDNDGNFFIVDRLKELIKVNGMQVAPAELEGFLLDHADVADCGVIPIPDEAAGERPLAFVALSLSAKERLDKDGGGKDGKEAQRIKEDIMQLVRDKKIKYKWLARVEFIDKIPATASGKILRRQLRDLAKKL